MPRSLLPLLAVLLLLGGGVIAWAATGGEDPAPAARSTDVPGVVAIARPIPSEPLTSGPSAELDAAYRAPSGGRRVVATFRQLRTYSGRPVDRRCMTIGSEATVRSTKRLLGNCLDLRFGEPWSLVVSADLRGPVVVSGIASPAVKQLTVAGPGGTFDVPRLRGGAFVVAYGKEATGRAVFTAQLRDGTTRFFRTDVPPVFTAPGAARAPDPGGLPDWTATAGRAGDGPSCVAVRQDTAVRAADPAQRGGLFLAAACGDLRRSPVIALAGRLMDLLPQELGSAARTRLPDRTVVQGAAGLDVERVTLLGPAGEVPLTLGPAGRAFIAVLPGGTPVSALAIRVQLRGGRVETYRDLDSVGGALLQRQPPYPLPGARIATTTGNSAVLDVRLSGAADRVSARLRGYRVALRRTGGSGRGARYQASLRPGAVPGGLARPGQLQRLVLQTCLGRQCSETLVRARVR